MILRYIKQFSIFVEKGVQDKEINMLMIEQFEPIKINWK